MTILPRSERLKNYASAFMTMWPLWVFLFGLLGYTNKDSITNWAGLAEADGETEIDANAQRWNDVAKFSEETKTRMDSIEAEIKSLKASIQTLTEREDQDIADLQKQINRWHPR